jgi:hypothetical protein
VLTNHKRLEILLGSSEIKWAELRKKNSAPLNLRRYKCLPR